jgi:tetratricopeptide (TPR) repeat protein
MRPLRFGSEFAAVDKDEIVFQGQSIVVHLTLSNLYNEPIEVRTRAGSWDEEVVFAAFNQATSSATALERLLAAPGVLPVRGAQARSIGRGTVLFGASDAQEITRRFRVQGADGTYVMRAALATESQRASGAPLPQQLAASLTFQLATPVTRSERLETIYREALVARAQGWLDEARDHVDELLRASPNSSAGLLLRGEISAKLGDTQQARRDFDEATRVLRARRDTDSAALGRAPAAVTARLGTVQSRARGLDRP